MPTRPNNLVGKRFGLLQVVKYSHATVVTYETRSRKQYHWLCLCDCGVEITVQSAYLTTGDTSSCGCLRAITTSEMMATHGLSDSPEFTVWSGMMQRCNPNLSKSFPNYGGRGIYVTPAWHSFRVFFDDMGKRPTAQHTLERRDNDGPYSKENCEWATRTQQARNTRRSVHLMLHGVTRSMPEWAELLGVSYYALRARRQRGWSDEAALTTPIGGKK